MGWSIQDVINKAQNKEIEEAQSKIAKERQKQSSQGGWLHGSIYKKSANQMPEFRGNTPQEAKRWIQNNTFYHAERTFHAKKYGGHGNANLQNRPDVVKAINLYLQKAQGLTNGKRWKKDFEGPIKGILRAFTRGSGDQIWLMLDAFHDQTDKSDHQVDDEKSFGEVASGIINTATGVLTGNAAAAVGGGQQLLTPGIGNTQQAGGVNFGGQQQQYQQNRPLQAGVPRLQFDNPLVIAGIGGALLLVVILLTSK